MGEGQECLFLQHVYSDQLHHTACEYVHIVQTANRQRPDMWAHSPVTSHVTVLYVQTGTMSSCVVKHMLHIAGTAEESDLLTTTTTTEKTLLTAAADIKKM